MNTFHGLSKLTWFKCFIDVHTTAYCLIVVGICVALVPIFGALQSGAENIRFLAYLFLGVEACLLAIAIFWPICLWRKVATQVFLTAQRDHLLNIRKSLSAFNQRISKKNIGTDQIHGVLHAVCLAIRADVGVTVAIANDLVAEQGTFPALSDCGLKFWLTEEPSDDGQYFVLKLYASYESPETKARIECFHIIWTIYP
jgi:hypothetical protein